MNVYEQKNADREHPDFAERIPEKALVAHVG